MLPRFSMRTLFIAITLIALILGSIASFAAFLDRRETIRNAELTRLVELDKKTTVEIVNDVEVIRARLGRAPRDEAELVGLMRRPMPVVHDHEYATPIHYQRTGDNSFMLQYELWATDDWIYDSNKPNAGWVQHWY